MNAVVTPRVFISAVEKSPAVVTPKVYISAVPKKPAVITPHVFISAIDSREVATADTLRHVSNTSWEGEEVATADTSRRLLDVATADTLRRLERTEIATADVKIRRPRELRYVIETPARRKLLTAAPALSLANSFKDYDVTSFSVTLNERTLSDNFSIETAQPFEIEDAVKGTLLDYPFSFLVEKIRQQGLIQTVKGMYDKDKQLYTHVYESNATIEKSSGYATISSSEGYTIIDNPTTKPTASEYVSQIANYFSLTPNVKIQDFTSSRNLEDQKITYSDLISSLFSWTSNLPQRQINVFIRGDTLHVIQRGMEDSAVDISGWRHSRPVVDKELIRTLYNNPSSSPSESISIGTNGSGSSGNDWYTKYYADIDEVDISTPFSGTIDFTDNGSYTSMTYEEGLLRSEKSRTSNKKVKSSFTTDYWYTQIGGEYYLKSKRTTSTTIQYNGVQEIEVGETVVGSNAQTSDDNDKNRTKIETTSVNDYFHKITGDDNVYLYEEYEGNYKVEYDYTPQKNEKTGDVIGYEWKLTDKETNDRQTFHIPVGNGWYATSVYLNGEPQGSTLSQGKPDNKVSQYTINEVQKIFKLFATVTGPGASSGGSGSSSDYDIDDDDWRNRLSPIDDIQFPVVGADLLLELTEALYWLNRKTQETVSVDIIDKISNGIPTINHIVDFTERVILDGNEYFLISNQIQFTPRSLIQKLQLVRWY